MNPDTKGISPYKELAQHGSSILVRAMALSVLKSRMKE